MSKNKQQPTSKPHNIRTSDIKNKMDILYIRECKDNPGGN